MKRVTFIFGLAIAIVIAAFTIFYIQDCAEDTDPPLTQKTELQIDESSLDWDVDKILDTYTLTITGTITNVSGRRLTYAEVTFTVYNSSNVVIGTALANINYLDSGAKWNFSALAVTSEQPARFVFANFTTL